MKNADKYYIKFVDSQDMSIPDNDCSEYREQSDYAAIKFMLNEMLESLALAKGQFDIVKMQRDRLMEAMKKQPCKSRFNTVYVHDDLSCEKCKVIKIVSAQ